MTQNNKSYLFLNRLVVITHQGTIAYDEFFHKGVNIIRGKNSSGKSTVLNFIFYALGGDYNNWNAESLKCREVFAEVSINNATYTLRRNVTASLKQPMSIYWGNFEEAKTDTLNWKTFSYSQNDDRMSFTNVIFSALSYPEIRSETDNNITLHQLLRLIYIDQDSPTQCLFRRENFDLPNIRLAISEMLLGIYDDTLYNNRLALRKAKKDYDDKKREFGNLNKLYLQSGNATTIVALNKEVEKLKSDIEKNLTEIAKIREVARLRITKKTAPKVEILHKELMRLRQSLRRLTTDLYHRDLDIVDSKYFIDTLKKRVIDLNNSILTKKILGELTLTNCPQCLNPLGNHVPDGHCFLCKQPLSDDEERTHAKRLKQEIELQIKESEILLVRKERKLNGLISDIPALKEKINLLQKELDIAISESQSTRDDKIDELFVLKGRQEKQLEFLTQQLKGIDLLEQLKKELSDLSALISELTSTIEQLELSQKTNRDRVMAVIEKFAIYILQNDLDRQKEFQKAKKIEIDFYGDSFSLDGDFNFSASSNTYLKNAIRYAIFIASLRVSFMRYPKFILCDNMEDKGMEKERIQNLQKLVVRISESLKDKEEHQIIFSTSMIADELNNTPHCVGDDYNQDNKTLKVYN
ncbi:MAG: AAA family ATPase [Bacteriodetes bacterium]|nr:AAA family ATPase [Bacteroidota bacterium]